MPNPQTLTGFSYSQKNIIIPQEWENRRTRLIRSDSGDLYHPKLFPHQIKNQRKFPSLPTILLDDSPSKNSISTSATQSSSNLSLAWDYLDNMKLTKWPRINTPVPLDRIQEIEPLYSVDVNIRNERDGSTTTRRFFM